MGSFWIEILVVYFLPKNEKSIQFKMDMFLKWVTKKTTQKVGLWKAEGATLVRRTRFKLEQHTFHIRNKVSNSALAAISRPVKFARRSLAHFVSRMVPLLAWQRFQGKFRGVSLPDDDL